MVASDSGGHEVDSNVGWLVTKRLDKCEKSHRVEFWIFFLKEKFEALLQLINGFEVFWTNMWFCIAPSMYSEGKCECMCSKSV